MDLEKIKKPLQQVAAAIAIVSTLIVIISKGLEVYSGLQGIHVLSGFEVENLRWIVPLLEVVTILSLLTASFWPPRMNEKIGYDTAIAATNQFCGFWLGAWITFAFFYAVASYKAFTVHDGDGSPILTGAMDALNVLSTVFLYLCYLVMALRSIKPHAEQWHASISRVVFGVFVLLAIRLFFWNHEQDQFYFKAVVGLLAGVALALLTGRLESLYIGANRYVVALIYGYAVLQMAYPFSDDQDKLTGVVIFSLALVLKVCFYLEVRSIIRSGRLTYYMHAHRALLESVEERRKVALDQLVLKDPDGPPNGGDSGGVSPVAIPAGAGIPAEADHD